ncbi:suppressor of fused domain protein [Foetidibacter luteolus]|uniref:suppressor of fused domain protein n=1 Tax=Foetidibacter luteolus TaxID=2608880 RepID=UPI00129A45B3|nr:suppressor of fused domain protein [Foetidibacter luteolus]
MAEQEFSESGMPVYRHTDASRKSFTPAIGDGDCIAAISEHIEKHIGKIESVFHEIVSDLVHIDVYWVKPSTKFPFHSLVTSGMSDKPMNVPDGLEKFRYTELCILLPEEWIIKAENYLAMEEAFKDENNYWPVRWLKTIARFPHEYDTWVGYGHTIPNGENASPFADSTMLGCMMLMPSLSLGGKFYQLKINEEKTIKFYCLYPLYKEEMDFKLRKGVDALLEKFEQSNIMDIVDIKRPNTCLKKGFLGLW